MAELYNAEGKVVKQEEVFRKYKYHEFIFVHRFIFSIDQIKQFLFKIREIAKEDANKVLGTAEDWIEFYKVLKKAEPPKNYTVSDIIREIV